MIGVGISAAKKAVESDPSVKQHLVEIAKDTPAFQRAAGALAEKVEIRQTLMLKVYRVVAKLFGSSQDYFEHQFAIDMAEKTADIPEENITAPKPSVAIPAMQGLAYSLDEPDLKEMYLNLLTIATDDRRSEKAHPSFAEIIKQISAAEADLLSLFLPSSGRAIVQLTRTTAGEIGGVTLRNHVIQLLNSNREPVEEPRTAMWIDNWQRLGLVDVRYDEYFTAEDAYDWAETRPETLAMRATYVSETVAVDVQKGICRTTDFGRQFAEAVLPVRVPAPTSDESTDSAPAESREPVAPRPAVYG